MIRINRVAIMFLSILALFVLIVTVDAVAQDDAKKDQNPPARQKQDSENKDKKKDQEADEEEASLDELLGLEEDADAKEAQKTTEKEAEDALERALNAERISSAFKEAIRKMALSATMLGEDFDTGLSTQRIQEDILSKLDVLIESAKKQQSSSSSSSSSSQQQQQQQEQQSRKQQQNQQQQQSANQQRNPNPADSSEMQSPPEQAGDINQMLEETNVEWGALPERVREQLLQTLRDRPSSLYRRLTDEYFRRIAEESTK